MQHIQQMIDQHGGFEAVRTFLVAPAEQGTTWTPLTFENSYLGCYKVVASVTPAGLIEARDPALMRDLRDFATQWDINLKAQGGVLWMRD
jgi:hypothetical protein